jgi:hypothetical protein
MFCCCTCTQAQRDALKQQQHLLQLLQNGQQLPHIQPPSAPATQQAPINWHSLAKDASAHSAVGVLPCNITAAAAAATAGVGEAVKFSQALTAAEADRRAALQQAAAAQGESQKLREQLQQQEQELHHLRR